MAKHAMTIHLNENEAEWLNEKAEQGYKKAGVIHFLMKEAMANAAVSNNLCELKRLLNGHARSPEGSGTLTGAPASTACRTPKAAEKHEEDDEGYPSEQEIRGYAEAIRYFIDNPEAAAHLDDTLKAYLEYMKKKIAAAEAEEAAETD